MPTPFDPGYGREPFDGLCAAAPADSAYPSAAFRVEWGPIFHRGRLDGTARVLVIGQDPAQHETIARRILVGEAGHRLQGLLYKLGVERSYVMVNAFLYSLFGQHSGGAHVLDVPIVRYRNRWLDAIFAANQIEAVIALGQLAEQSWQKWAATKAGRQVSPAFVRVTHPTQPESSSGGDAAKHARAITAMLANWNAGMQAIAPAIAHPDRKRALAPYGTAFADGDKRPIPMADLPAGTPAWMATDDGWADRTGTGRRKRATITVTVPAAALP